MKACAEIDKINCEWFRVGIIVRGESQVRWRIITCPSANYCTTSSTWTGLESSVELRGQTSET